MSPTVRRRTVSELVARAHAGSPASSRPVCAAPSRASSARGATPVEDLVGDRALREQRQARRAPVGGEDHDAVRVRPEAGARLGDVVGDEQVDALAAELVGGPIERARLGGEPDEDRSRARPPRAPRRSRPTPARMSSVGSSSRVRPSSRASLVVGRPSTGRKSATAAAMTRASRAGDRRRATARAHLGGRLGADDRDRASAGSGTLTLPTTSVTRAPRSRAASAMATPILPVERLPMNRTGIDRLGRAAGADHDDGGPRGRRRAASRRSAAGSPGPGSRIGRPGDGRDDGVDDRRRSRRAGPGPIWPARERAGLRLDDPVAEVVAQPGDVGPGRRMGVHLAVHRRRDDDRRRRREAGRGHGVAGEAGRHRRQPVGGRRRDDDRIGAVGDDDVADPLVGEERRRRRSRPGGGSARRTSAAPTKRVADGVIRTTTSAPSSPRRRTRSAAL